jgi:peroxiredoxin
MDAGPAAAPAFTLELLDGKTLRLADYKGSRVILLFWAPW